MTKTTAQDIADRLRHGTDDPWPLIAEMNTTRGWLALGYISWRDYWTTELSDMSPAPGDEERVVATLYRLGVKTRPIALATGVGERRVKKIIDTLAAPPDRRATPAPANFQITEDGFTVSGKANLRRQIDAAERVLTQLRAAADALEIYFPEGQFNSTFTRDIAHTFSCDADREIRRIRKSISPVTAFGKGNR